MISDSALVLSQVRQFLGMIDTAKRGAQASLADGTVDHFRHMISKLIVVLSDADLTAGYDEATKIGGSEADLFAFEMERRREAG